MATRRGLSVDEVLNLLDEDSGQSDDEFEGYIDEKDSEEELEASAIDGEEMDDVEAEEQSVSDAEREEQACAIDADELHDLVDEAEHRVRDAEEEGEQEIDMETDSTHGNIKISLKNNNNNLPQLTF